VRAMTPADQGDPRGRRYRARAGLDRRMDAGLLAGHGAAAIGEGAGDGADRPVDHEADAAAAQGPAQHLGAGGPHGLTGDGAGTRPSARAGIGGTAEAAAAAAPSISRVGASTVTVSIAPRVQDTTHAGSCKVPWRGGRLPPASYSAWAAC
jgi:hypothetical protein